MRAWADKLTAKLQTSPYLPLRELTCVPCGGELVVRGQVPTYFLKRQLWRIASSISVELFLQDEVDVIPPRARAPYASAPFQPSSLVTVAFPSNR